MDFLLVREWSGGGRDFGECDARATHINAGLQQLAAETSELPVGAVVLLSDGAENSGGIDIETINALHNRRLPVHTDRVWQREGRGTTWRSTTWWWRRRRWPTRA